jgi:dipeptidyl aminopeptidase/acylaminoacyl peptidase
MNLVSDFAEFTDLTRICSSPDGKKILLGVSSWNQPALLLGFDLDTRTKRVFARTIDYVLNVNDLSKPTAVTWRTEKLEECHGLLYMPASSRFTNSKDKPPLLVHIHGGPTSQTVANFSATIQFFANRGYAVLAVNHRGSTGYGRAYMEKLRGKWGVVDVADSVYGARHFADAGLIDGSKVVIMGGSAGGYTVLQAMVNEPEVFAAGISLYGISNLFTLAKDTHKFEAFYNDSLLGPLPGATKIYQERSPEFHAGSIKKPLAIFQGDKDVVVPKNQAEAIVKALSKVGTPYIYHLYEGEGHGFTKPENIKHLYSTIDEFLKENVISAN